MAAIATAQPFAFYALFVRADVAMRNEATKAIARDVLNSFWQCQHLASAEMILLYKIAGLCKEEAARRRLEKTFRGGVVVIGSAMRQLICKIARRLIPPAETLEGYEHPELVDVVFEKTKAYEAQGEWPEMIGVSSVLDFGGGCGLHYKQARSPNVRWAVVETPAMVERAKELATDRLRFFTGIPEARAWLADIDVMHSNGALQYTPDPEYILGQLCNLGAKKMLWYRALLGEPRREIQSSLLGDNGPGALLVKKKTVRYARTKIPEQTFLDSHKGYSLVERGVDWFSFTRATSPLRA